MNREIDVDLADARHRTHSRNSTDRLLALLIEHHDYSVRMPEGYVKPEPVVYVPPAEPTPEYKALWFGVVSELPPEPRIPTIEKIQRVVADHYGVTRLDIVSDRRTARCVRPRQIAAYLSKKLTANSYPQIGRKFGGRDHSTVVHSINKVEHLIATDGAVAATIAVLTEKLSPVMEAAE